MAGRLPAAAESARFGYLVAGLLCAILDEASRDLGLIPAARTRFRTAFLCGEPTGLALDLRDQIRTATTPALPSGDTDR